MRFRHSGRACVRRSRRERPDERVLRVLWCRAREGPKGRSNVDDRRTEKPLGLTEKPLFQRQLQPGVTTKRLGVTNQQLGIVEKRLVETNERPGWTAKLLVSTNAPLFMTEKSLVSTDQQQ